MRAAADEGTASFRFRRSRSNLVVPLSLGITAVLPIWLLEAFRIPHALSLPVSQRQHLCDHRPTSRPHPTLTWTLFSRITNSHYLGKASRTAGL